MNMSQHPLLSICLYGNRNIQRQTLALHDTGSLDHNWISAQMVQDLGLSQSIYKSYTAYIGTIDATGQRISSIGLPTVEWGLPDQELWTASFNVWHSKDFSVIFGHRYMYKMGMVEFSNVGITPRVPAEKLTEEEKKENIAQEEDNRAKLEAQRRREAHE